MNNSLDIIQKRYSTFKFTNDICYWSVIRKKLKSTNRLLSKVMVSRNKLCLDKNYSSLNTRLSLPPLISDQRLPQLIFSNMNKRSNTNKNPSRFFNIKIPRNLLSDCNPSKPFVEVKHIRRLLTINKPFTLEPVITSLKKAPSVLKPLSRRPKTRNNDLYNFIGSPKRRETTKDCKGSIESNEVKEEPIKLFQAISKTGKIVILQKLAAHLNNA